jgi:hypothetical protein
LRLPCDDALGEILGAAARARFGNHVAVMVFGEAVFGQGGWDVGRPKGRGREGRNRRCFAPCEGEVVVIQACTLACQVWVLPQRMGSEFWTPCEVEVRGGCEVEAVPLVVVLVGPRVGSSRGRELAPPAGGAKLAAGFPAPKAGHAQRRNPVSPFASPAGGACFAGGSLVVVRAA